MLAQQPAGYFLLNDILRYVNEGEEEATEGAVSESAPAVEMEAPHQEPAAATDSAAVAVAPEPEKAQVEQPAEPSPATLDAEVVDKKLEEASSTAKDTPSTTAAETPVEAVPAVEEAPSKAEEAQTSADPEKTAQEIAEEEAKKPELPKDPSPTPAPSRAPAPEPEKPKGPPKPMSWASRAAAAVGVPVKPVVPLPKAAPAAAAPAQQRSAAAPAPAQPKAAAAPAQASENTAQAADKDAASEWRTAGADSKRQSRQQATSTPPAEKEGTLAYVKFVTDKVKDDDLRAALGSYGEMVYFDINRSKVCSVAPVNAESLDLTCPELRIRRVLCRTRLPGRYQCQPDHRERREHRRRAASPQGRCLRRRQLQPEPRKHLWTRTRLRRPAIRQPGRRAWWVPLPGPRRRSPWARRSSGHQRVSKWGRPAASLDGNFIEYSRESWEFLSWSDGVLVVA